MKKIEVCAVQFRSILGQVEKNTEAVIHVVQEVMDKHPDTSLIVFPEMSLYGYEELNRLRERNRLDEMEMSLARICQCAEKFRTAVVAGYARRDPHSGKIFNSIAYIGWDGRILCSYDKIHLAKPDRTVFEEGGKCILVNDRGLKIGLLICWDCIFPEPARLYSQMGADLLIVSAAWENPYGEQWETALKARALDNGVFVVGANRVGRDRLLEFPGSSMIIDRMGRILAETTGTQTSYAGCILDLEGSLPERLKFGMPVQEARLKYHADTIGGDKGGNTPLCSE